MFGITRAVARGAGICVSRRLQGASTRQWHALNRRMLSQGSGGGRPLAEKVRAAVMRPGIFVAGVASTAASVYLGVRIGEVGSLRIAEQQKEREFVWFYIDVLHHIGTHTLYDSKEKALIVENLSRHIRRLEIAYPEEKFKVDRLQEIDNNVLFSQDELVEFISILFLIDVLDRKEYESIMSSLESEAGGQWKEYAKSKPAEPFI